MIVVDTNVISYFYLESKHTAVAEQAWREHAEWAAPLLWRSEFRNVLALYIRNGRLTLEDSRQIMSSAVAMMEAHEYHVNSDRVLELVAESRCSAYDCEFVALAQELGSSLVTVDKQILKDFPSVAMSLADFVKSQEAGD